MPPRIDHPGGWQATGSARRDCVWHRLVLLINSWSRLGRAGAGIITPRSPVGLVAIWIRSHNPGAGRPKDLDHGSSGATNRTRSGLDARQQAETDPSLAPGAVTDARTKRGCGPDRVASVPRPGPEPSIDAICRARRTNRPRPLSPGPAAGPAERPAHAEPTRQLHKLHE